VRDELPDDVMLRGRHRNWSVYSAAEIATCRFIVAGPPWARRHPAELRQQPGRRTTNVNGVCGISNFG
jgi:hypothetical protein